MFGLLKANFWVERIKPRVMVLEVWFDFLILGLGFKVIGFKIWLVPVYKIEVKTLKILIKIKKHNHGIRLMMKVLLKMLFLSSCFCVCIMIELKVSPKGWL
jgi:hypothetical protein